MTEKVSTTLTIKDKFTGPLQRVTKEIKKFTEQTSVATKDINRLSKQSKKAFGKIQKDVSKTSKNYQKQTEQIRSKFEGFNKRVKKGFNNIKNSAKNNIKDITKKLLGMGFKEAFDMEGYRIRLEGLIGDTKKASEIMQYAIKQANRTPFETGSMIEASAKLETMGMSAKKYLSPIADMAGATNSDILKATEAVVNAQIGEFQRLKEFGISKDQIMAESAKRYGANIVFDSKGQMLSQQKMMTVVMDMIEKKYDGGADKLSRTAKGLWDKITGMTKNSLANIIGITDDGTIRQGSAFDNVKKKALEFAEKLQQMKEDGYIKEWAKKVDKAMSKVSNVILKIINIIKALWKYRDVILAVTTGVVAFKAAMKGIKFIGFIKDIKKTAKTFSKFMKLLGLNPWALLIAGIVTLGVLVWKNWDSITSYTGQALEWIKEKLAQFKEGIVKIASGIWEGLKDGVKRFANFFINIANTIIEGLNKISFKIPDKIPEIGGIKFGIDIPTIPEFALGTDYFSGGLARTDEFGGEIKQYPSGTTIIPADKSENILNNVGKKVDVNINIQGNVIGNKDFANILGNIVYKKVNRALNNM